MRISQNVKDMGKGVSYLVYYIIVFCALVMGACAPKDEPTPMDNKPLIILDADLGSSTDDLFAMEILYDYHRRGLCTLLGIIVDREGANCAACADVMNTWHGLRALPIGLVRDGLKSPKVWIDYRQMPYYKKPDSTYMFRRLTADYASLPDGWELYRELLSQQPDHSVIICSTGQRMWDVCAVMNAVEGDRFILSERGTVELTPECFTVFTPSATGNCRYQKPGDTKWAQQILSDIREVAIWRP